MFKYVKHAVVRKEICDTGGFVSQLQAWRRQPRGGRTAGVSWLTLYMFANYPNGASP